LEHVVARCRHRDGRRLGIAFIIFCHRHCDSWADVGIALYLFGMLGSYITSTAYHALPPTKRAKAVLRRWDHAAIYWHIAGSYSPITLIALRQQGFWGGDSSASCGCAPS